MTQEQPTYILELEEKIAKDSDGTLVKTIRNTLDAEKDCVSHDIRQGRASEDFKRLNVLLGGLEAARAVIDSYWASQHST
ncbi:MAG: hypothetical protein GDA54_03645 [Alphaproteobacteria bacterium GM7ARS4]|nr:hypothetical protein [Alphaproteobacteria bacterium GM7ARS4]